LHFSHSKLGVKLEFLRLRKDDSKAKDPLLKTEKKPGAGGSHL
jgi:hypothetical protein